MITAKKTPSNHIHRTFPTINIEKQSVLWSLGKEKLYKLLDAMGKVHMLRTIKKQNAFNMYLKGEKICDFLADNIKIEVSGRKKL